MSLINQRRRSARWHGANQKVGQSAAPLFLDRIDLQIDVVPVPIKDLSDAPAGESSEEIRKRVIAARQIQENRFKNCPGIHCNAQMTEKMLQQYATPPPRGCRTTPTSHGTTATLCTCLQPHTQGGTHHRRPRRCGGSVFSTHLRSHQLPQPRPWRLGGEVVSRTLTQV